MLDYVTCKAKKLIVVSYACFLCKFIANGSGHLMIAYAAMEFAQIIIDGDIFDYAVFAFNAASPVFRAESADSHAMLVDCFGVFHLYFDNRY